VNTALVANARSGQVTLSWKGYAGAASYTVCNLTRSDCRSNVTTTAYQFTALANGTPYSFQVTPVFAGGTVAGAISNLAAATPKALVP
jgi:hypothetical protein